MAKFGQAPPPNQSLNLNRHLFQLASHPPCHCLNLDKYDHWRLWVSNVRILTSAFFSLVPSNIHFVQIWTRRTTKTFHQSNVRIWRSCTFDTITRMIHPYNYLLNGVLIWRSAVLMLVLIFHTSDKILKLGETATKLKEVPSSACFKNFWFTVATTSEFDTKIK